MSSHFEQNSRQRRRLAAKKHNMAILEKEAYAEDRIRDPKKYFKPRNKRTEQSVMRALVLCASISSTAFADRHLR